MVSNFLMLNFLMPQFKSHNFGQNLNFGKSRVSNKLSERVTVPSSKLKQTVILLQTPKQRVTFMKNDFLS